MMNDFCPSPLIEGEVPIKYGGFVVIDDTMELRETETYLQEDKDEFYDNVIRCKGCNTTFIAYSEDYKSVRNYCPGCGKKLV